MSRWLFSFNQCYVCVVCDGNSITINLWWLCDSKSVRLRYATVVMRSVIIISLRPIASVFNYWCSRHFALRTSLPYQLVPIITDNIMRWTHPCELACQIPAVMMSAELPVIYRRTKSWLTRGGVQFQQGHCIFRSNGRYLPVTDVMVNCPVTRRLCDIS